VADVGSGVEGKSGLPLSLDALKGSVVSCQRCPLWLERTQVVCGEGPHSARYVIVGEAPGKEEDLSGRPFVGRSGRLLRELIERVAPAAVDRGEVYVTNTVKCRPPLNRTPRTSEVCSCSEILKAEIALLSPEVLVTLGRVATRALLGFHEPLRELRGRAFVAGNVTVIPTFHPAAALRGGAAVADLLEADLRYALSGSSQRCNPGFVGGAQSD
jgi:DNA polymerase